MRRLLNWNCALPAIGLLAVVILFTLTVRPAAAASIVVDSSDDTTTAGDGDCTLREAINNANSDSDTTGGDCDPGSGADAITFAADYTITLDGNQLPAVTTAMTITGNGAGATIIQAAAAANTADWRVFEVGSGGALQLWDLTVRHGRCVGSCPTAGDSGGGIMVLGNAALSLYDSHLTANAALTFGGALYAVDSQVRVERTSFTGNSTGAGGAGGAIGTIGGRLDVFDSTFTTNIAQVGGALYNIQGGFANVSGSTFDRNQAATNFGGGVFNNGTINVTNSTFSGNSAGAAGGGLANDGTATVTNSTFAGNTSGFLGSALHTIGQETTNAVNSIFVRGNNVNCTTVAAAADSIADDGTCGTATVDGTVGTFLGPLADNGGPTQTHALLPGSAAIDVNANTSCTAAPVSGVDQRGEPRNVDVPGTGNDGGSNLCDAGAYEANYARLTLEKVTTPAGGQGFPFTIDPGAYSFDFKFGSSGSAVFQFREPADIAFDAAGNVLVADLANFRIKKHQADGLFLTTWGTGPGNGDGFFDLPYGVAVGPDGSVYVADTDNDRIQKFDSDGNYLDQWGTNGSGNGEFAGPHGVAVDAAGFVYVTDFGNNRVQKFTSVGVYVDQWGTGGSGNGQFDHPWGIAVDAAGNVFVADRDNHRIQKFDSAGAYLTQWGGFGSGDGQFNLPFDVAVDAAGNVYVADTSNHRIQKFTYSGGFLGKWGSGPGSGDGQLNTPLGLGVNAAGQVYVADAFNDRIQVFSPDLSTILDDGQSDSFFLLPGLYRVSELVPAGWTLDGIQCDSDSYGVDGQAVEVLLGPGNEMTCTATNSRPPSVCPANAPGVGLARTSIIGTGMGDTKTTKLVAKLNIPNAGDLTEIYGQMAAKQGGLFKYVRFIYPNKAFEQVQPETSLGLPLAISWWGADLDPNDLTQPFVTGRWFPAAGTAKKKLPRAFILYPTYRTAEETANAFETFAGTNNWVAEPGTSGWPTSETFLLEIPETQGVTDISGQLALVDNDVDARGYRVILRAGSATTTLDGAPGANTNGKLLDILSFTLANVPAGTRAIEIELTVDHLPAAERESVALIGATANYSCAVSGP
jgi:CSLREA domain-containing protein